MTSGAAATGVRKKQPDSASATRDRNPETGAGGPILVLGMHRSGTSALAQTLNLLGVAVGDEDALLPAHPTDNPRGYWERSDIVASHDEFLASAGYSWSRVAGITASDFDSVALQVLEERLRQIITRLDQGGRPWLVKDPRLCLLLPQWSRLVDGIACVVAVRDPRDVAASILREGLRGAFTSNFLLALWEKYLRTALVNLAGKPEHAGVRKELHAILRSQIDPDGVTQQAFREQERRLAELVKRQTAKEFYEDMAMRLGEGQAAVLTGRYYNV